MKRFIFVLSLLALLLMCLPFPQEVREKPATVVASVTQTFVPILCTISKTNLFDGLFTEPFEIAFFFFADGTVYLFTNQLSDRIIFPNLEEFFEKDGREVKDILLVVHNHSSPARFSEPDKMLLARLKDNGFEGRFAVYYPFSKSMLFFE